MSTRTQLNMLGTYIPIALVVLSWTFKSHLAKDIICGIAILLVSISTGLYFALRKRGRL